ncbi:MAG: hypothetical protein LQ350_001180 [Teloschistes chrysophthalmus]|nr:MAG: hypothetical protein LQ350_001180 [Niorma chrysophthalma]
MPKAEVGSTKYLNNKLKSKGLQRLRWYCQACEKQCRDENGFKMHTQSESHVRQMLLIGEDPRKHINDFSNQFQRDFLLLLRTAHGEKQVHMNHFYQEYIGNKEHIHMNSTRWPSLTEFAKHLGREGICRVEDLDKGLHIAWIDNSPEALRRQDAIRKKERQDRGDEEREQALIREQVARAERDAAAQKVAGGDAEEEDETRLLKREEGGKIKLDFGTKAKEHKDPPPPMLPGHHSNDGDETTMADVIIPTTDPPQVSTPTPPPPPPEKISLRMNFAGRKPKNVFAAGKKYNSAPNGTKASPAKEAAKRPMSEAERIMRDEIERKRLREANAFLGLNRKRQKTS